MKSLSARNHSIARRAFQNERSRKSIVLIQNHGATSKQAPVLLAKLASLKEPKTSRIFRTI